ncbi:MAG: hypothetical protein LBJ14_11160 [Desulfarculales bacterium]|jgi:hypothetical protein|nr:hypothetical protein [Desulfarculales bacterium]
MKTDYYQFSFTGGVIADTLKARLDIVKYASGAKSLQNMTVMPQGGVSKRPGFRFLSLFPGEARMIDFVYNESQSYVLLFTQGYMYIGVYDGLITGGDGNPLKFASPYSLEQALALDYAQCADIMYLTHPDFPPYKISRYSHTNWTFSQVDFNLPPAPTASGPIHPPAPGALSVTISAVQPPDSGSSDGGGGGAGA